MYLKCKTLSCLQGWRERSRKNMARRLEVILKNACLSDRGLATVPFFRDGPVPKCLRYIDSHSFLYKADKMPPWTTVLLFKKYTRIFSLVMETVSTSSQAPNSPRCVGYKNSPSCDPILTPNQGLICFVNLTTRSGVYCFTESPTRGS